MKPERVMEIATDCGMVNSEGWTLRFARRIESEVLREAANVADSFVRSGDWDNDCCVGIRESILALIPEQPE